MAKFLAWFLSFLFFCAVIAVAGIIVVIVRYEQGLPNYMQLQDYKPAITTRLYAGDGSLLAEYAVEKRIFVPVQRMPTHVLQAFIAAEDKNFYNHGGVDYAGVVRAVITNVKNYGKGRRMVGASTITQQVAKNFLLNNEVSFDRKIREALIAFRMEKTFTKEHILELYLNEIYLGRTSYGVAAAALNYFNKSLEELTLAEAAFLAALPKAPNNYDPVKKKAAAIERRNWVLDRMTEDGYISKQQADEAKDDDIVLMARDKNKAEEAEYFAEEVRRQIAEKYGEESLYQGGLDIRTSLDPDLQMIATKALQQGLINFDRINGYRGPVTHFKTKEQALAEKFAGGVVVVDTLEDLSEPTDEKVSVSDTSGTSDADVSAVPAVSETQEAAVSKEAEGKSAIDDIAMYDLPFIDRLKAYPLPDFVPQGWRLALVTAMDDYKADIIFADETTDFIPIKGMTWARVKNDDGTLGAKVAVPSNVLEVGDVVWVEKVVPENKEEAEYYGLRQMPEVNGAIVAIDPNTGRVLAMSGGISFKQSQFNRAVQAKRQPGSSFKPFVYMAALDSGYTPATLILDAPFVLDQGPDKPKWKPSNYVQTYYGPTTLRVGLEKSRNLMTVRLAKAVGMRKVVKYAKDFGIVDYMRPLLSMSIGAGETTMLRLIGGYSVFVNGGKKVEPSFIDRIQDRTGATIYRHNADVCPDCQNLEWQGQEVPEIADSRPQIADARSAYQIVNMLVGVVERGTGRSVRMAGVPLAGKTGTSDNYQDAWFVGFTSDLVVGVFVGYDTPASMGKKGSGATAAAPIFKLFMDDAVKYITPAPFRVPEGIKLVRVNHKTGLPAKPNDKEVVLEAFKLEDDVTKQGAVVGEDAASVVVDNEEENAPDIGGFY